MIRRLIGAGLLAVVWAAGLGNYSLMNFAIGFAVSLGVLWAVARGCEGGEEEGSSSVPRRKVGAKNLWATAVLGVYFVVELVLSSVRMVYYVLSPLSRLRPGVIAVELEAMSDSQVTVLANLISLTPGTLSVDVGTGAGNAEGRERVLYIHVMHIADAAAVREEISNGFGRRVREAFT